MKSGKGRGEEEDEGRKEEDEGRKEEDEGRKEEDDGEKRGGQRLEWKEGHL